MPSIESSPISASPLAISALEVGKPSIISAGRFALFLAVAISALFANVLFGGETFYYHDYGGFGYPLAKFHRECFWRGELPLWNPLSSCGIPFLAQWNTLTLYPLSLIYLMLPLPWSLNFFCLVHLFIAGLGMYFLARRWTKDPFAGAVAGAAFAFNGLTLHCLIWPAVIAGLSLTPWVLLSVDHAWSKGGRAIIWAGAMGALQLLTGAPEVILLTWAFACATAVLRISSCQLSWASTIRRTLAAAAIAAGLAALQLAPFLHLLAHSERNSSYGEASWSMPTWGWVNLVFPLFRTFRSAEAVPYQENQAWLSSYYPGIVVLFLALLAFRRQSRVAVWGLWTIAFLSVILALGETGYLYTLLYRIVPAVGFVRYPIKCVFLMIMALPLLAAIATTRSINPEPALRTDRIYATAVGIVMLILILAAATFAYQHPYGNWPWKDLWENAAMRAAWLTAAIATMLVLNSVSDSRRKLALQITLLALIVGDAWTHVPQQNPTAPSTIYQPGLLSEVFDRETIDGKYRAMAAAPVSDLLLHRSIGSAVEDYVGRRVGLLGDCNLVDGVASVDGFYPMSIFGQRQIWSKLFFVPLPDFPAPLADFVGIRQISTNLFDWKTRSSALPLVTAGAKPVFIERTNILRQISSPEFDPRKVVYLPLEAQRELSATNGVGAVGAISRTGSRIAVELAPANETNAVLLTVAESYYDGWRAFAGRQRLKLWQANHAFMAIEVPAGVQRVELVYKDDRFKWGMVISGSTVIGCIAAGFRYRKRLPAD